MKPSELKINRRQTTAYIKQNPTSITFNRNNPADDGAGGSRKNPTPLSAQTVRIIQQTETNKHPLRRNLAGEMVEPTLVLMCEYDTDVQNKDTFFWNGLRFEVVWITDLGYAKHAEVARL